MANTNEDYKNNFDSITTQFNASKSDREKYDDVIAIINKNSVEVFTEPTKPTDPQMQESEITKSLQGIVSNHLVKLKDNRVLKFITFFSTLKLIFLIVIGCIACGVLALVYEANTAIVVTSLVSMFGSVVSLMLIIVKYLFPENEDTVNKEMLEIFIKHVESAKN